MSAFGGLAALTRRNVEGANKYRHFLWGLLPKIGLGKQWGSNQARPQILRDALQIAPTGDAQRWGFFAASADRVTGGSFNHRCTSVRVSAASRSSRSASLAFASSALTRRLSTCTSAEAPRSYFLGMPGRKYPARISGKGSRSDHKRKATELDTDFLGGRKRESLKASHCLRDCKSDGRQLIRPLMERPEAPAKETSGPFRVPATSKGRGNWNYETLHATCRIAIPICSRSTR